MATYITQLRQRCIHGVNTINGLMRSWLRILVSAAKETLKPDTSIKAAAIAYFALFSLFPITILSISITSFSLDPLKNQQLIIQRLEFIAPAMGLLLGKNIDEIIKTRGPVTGVAFIGLVWSASTVFYIFTQTLNEIWGVKKRRAVWKRRGLSILFVLFFVGPALFLASLGVSMFAHLSILLPAQLISMAGGLSLVLAVLLDISLFMLLYMILPHGTAVWREVLHGAIGAGFLWELAKSAFLFFVSTYVSISNLVYGSVAAIIAFLAWAYVSGLIFLFGAYISVSYLNLKQPQKGTVDKIGQ
ncbi:MAG: YihY/virulence factor BrkB family protein [Chloroflexota bacterium]